MEGNKSGYSSSEITTQKEKNSGDNQEAVKAKEKSKRDYNDSEKRQQIRLETKNQLEHMPRFNYKAVRFYRHSEEMKKAIDSLYNSNINKITSRTLSENFVEEIYETYMILPGEYSRILKTTIVAFILGSFLGLFHGAGIISFPLLNPLSAGGIAVSAIVTAFILATLAALFRSILLIFRPISAIGPGFCMLTVYGDYEEKKKIESILKESVTIDI